jgi:16S rRNA (uracil1498-N3)-methyltransferase
MTRRRWIADEVSQNSAALTGSHAEHLVRVLRARLGQEFHISTPAGVRRGHIVRLEERRVEFQLGERVSSSALPDVTLALSIFKFDRMEWAIEKCTELGVARIVPAIARRSDAHLAAAAAKRMQRWQRIAHQASEQSRRDVPPEISTPVRLKEVAGLAGGIRVVLAESEHGVTLKDAFQAYMPGASVILAIGPEGGWTEAELELFRTAGWTLASLGSTILRAETAAIAATAVVLAELV